jgi:hypothetical protein
MIMFSENKWENLAFQVVLVLGVVVVLLDLMVWRVAG